eukprot:g6457.t1
MGGWFSRYPETVISVLWPAYHTYKALEASKEETGVSFDRISQWLRYWIVRAALAGVEGPVDDVGRVLVPFYYLLKLGALYWMANPDKPGSDELYARFVQNALHTHEPAIDAGLVAVRQRAGQLCEVALEHAQQHGAEVALVMQERLNDALTPVRRHERSRRGRQRRAARSRLCQVTRQAPAPDDPSDEEEKDSDSEEDVLSDTELAAQHALAADIFEEDEDGDDEEEEDYDDKVEQDDGDASEVSVGDVAPGRVRGRTAASELALELEAFSCSTDSDEEASHDNDSHAAADSDVSLCSPRRQPLTARDANAMDTANNAATYAKGQRSTVASEETNRLLGAHDGGAYDESECSSDHDQDQDQHQTDRDAAFELFERAHNFGAPVEAKRASV